MKSFEVEKSDNGGRKVKLLALNCESDDIESESGDINCKSDVIES